MHSGHYRIRLFILTLAFPLTVVFAFTVIFALTLFFPSASFAQQQIQQIAGRIEKKGSTEILAGVSVINLKRNKYNISDMGGNYKIPAIPGDSIIFSSAGYFPDTVIATSYMFDENFLILLTPHILSLASVEVDEMKNYRMDSVRRREEYGFILDRKHPIRLWNEKRPADGPGFSFSPIGFFSKREKGKRRLAKRLNQEEEDYYIDAKFSPARVARLTGLSGDSLRVFLFRYRPSYTFCRKTNNQDILFYINEKLTAFHRSSFPKP